MSQNVNLYLDEFQYHEPPCSGGTILNIWLITFMFALSIVLLLASALGFSQYKKKEYERLLSEQQAELGRVQKAYPPRKVNPALQRQLEFSNSLLENRKVLLRYLETNTNIIPESNPMSFSKRLINIAKVQEEKTWLLSVEMIDQNTSLSGKTLDYVVMPAYVQSLSQSLQREFKSFWIQPSDDDSPYWDFRLNTDVEDFKDEVDEEALEGKSISAEKAFGRLQ